MKIMKCAKCGKYIHGAPLCYHCGSTGGFESFLSEAVHERAEADCARVEALIGMRKFSEALALSYQALEWIPNSPSLFWLRLLARKECVSALELISKGFPCEDDPDFCNALRASTGEEHSVYADIQDAVRALQSGLREAITRHENRCKADTGILKLSGAMREELNVRREQLFSLWSKVQETEAQMYSTELDCQLLVQEHKVALQAAAQSAASQKNETYQKTECTAEEFDAYSLKLDSLLRYSSQAKKAVDAARSQHPWVRTFAELTARREEQLRDLAGELAALKSYEARVQKTLAEIDFIEKRHDTARQALEAFDLADAAALLGSAEFNQIFRNAGLETDAAISAPSRGWTPHAPESDAM